jgi:hypothetical protein
MISGRSMLRKSSTEVEAKPSKLVECVNSTCIAEPTCRATLPLKVLPNKICYCNLLMHVPVNSLHKTCLKILLRYFVIRMMWCLMNDETMMIQPTCPSQVRWNVAQNGLLKGMLEFLYQPSVWLNVVVQLLTNILFARVSTVVLTVGRAGFCNDVLIHSTVLITGKFVQIDNDAGWLLPRSRSPGDRKCVVSEMNTFCVCRLVTRRALVGRADHRPRTLVMPVKYLCAAALPLKSSYCLCAFSFILFFDEQEDSRSSFLLTDGNSSN